VERGAVVGHEYQGYWIEEVKKLWLGTKPKARCEDREEGIHPAFKGLGLCWICPKPDRAVHRLA